MTDSIVPNAADAVVCGAGMAGIAVAHALAQQGWSRVLIVDDLAPLSLTSDKSTEAYRNWWPGPDDAMVQLLDRSIDLLESWADASHNRFHLNRRGYLYATTSTAGVRRLEDEVRVATAQGAGPIRVYGSLHDARRYTTSEHRGYRQRREGADLFLDRAAIRHYFPWLAPDVRAVLHARRCGWFSGQQLGMHVLEKAREVGVTLVPGRVMAVDITCGEVSGVHVRSVMGSEAHIATSVFVNAAGPHAREVGKLVGSQLPLLCEPHFKVAIDDVQGALDRNTGLVILTDVQRLEWSDDERIELAASEETRWLTELLPAGVHLRPEGYGAARTVLMLWHHQPTRGVDVPTFPLAPHQCHAEVVLRGVARLVPGFAAYVDRLPPMFIDGGYYTKTIENRPLIGAVGDSGSFVCAGLSGLGLMASPAAAELLALQIAGRDCPAYASAFNPMRYDDPTYSERLASCGTTGQL